MIDRLAIATNGYRSIERKRFSASVDGYYVNKILVVIPIKPKNDVMGGLISDSYSRTEFIKKRELREEEELFLFIKIFLDTCHL